MSNEPELLDVYSSCPECNGTGQIPFGDTFDEPCGQCNGTGVEAAK